MDRGKVLSAEDIEELGEFARYRDVDGDGIPYRTLPGNEHPRAPYFTRGTGHDERAVYSESPHDWQVNTDRIQRKLETARGLLPKAVIDDHNAQAIGIIAYGSTDPAVQEARDRLTELGVETDYLRLRSGGDELGWTNAPTAAAAGSGVRLRNSVTDSKRRASYERPLDYRCAHGSGGFVNGQHGKGQEEIPLQSE